MRRALTGAWHMLPAANLARLAATQGWDLILIDTVSHETRMIQHVLLTRSSVNP